MGASDFKRSFPPVIGGEAKVLILGSLPGEESLRQGQYYAYRHNAFWPIMGKLLAFDPSLPYEERLECLKAAGVALWDVIGSARRKGSLDLHIREIEPNPVARLLSGNPGIGFIGCNGAQSYTQLKRSAPELFSKNPLVIARLPSTSPAAAAMRFEEKLAAWRIVLDFLQPSGRQGETKPMSRHLPVATAEEVS